MNGSITATRNIINPQTWRLFWRFCILSALDFCQTDAWLRSTWLVSINSHMLPGLDSVPQCLRCDVRGERIRLLSSQAVSARQLSVAELQVGFCFLHRSSKTAIVLAPSCLAHTITIWCLISCCENFATELVKVSHWLSILEQTEAFLQPYEHLTFICILVNASCSSMRTSCSSDRNAGGRSSCAGFFSIYN